LNVIEPATRGSENLERMFRDVVKPNMEIDQGFLIITLDGCRDHSTIFNRYVKIQSQSQSVDSEDGSDEEDELEEEIRKHISICYYPYLSEYFEYDSGTPYQTIHMSLNDVEIRPFSHSHYDIDEIEDNAEIDFASEYTCIIPYRMIDDKKACDFNSIFFESKNEKFRFNCGTKEFPKSFSDMGIEEDHYKQCTIRFTKLSPICQKTYNTEYNFEKNKQCSCFVYRNGVCSDTSYIPFEGEGGFRPTDCPQMRGELHCSNDFDDVIQPGSNKSLIRPNPQFTQALRYLGNYVRKDIFKRNEKKTCLQTLEGKEYFVTPKKVVLHKETQQELGVIKGGQVRWNKCKLTAKEKKLIMTKQNHSTPLLAVDIESHQIKDKKGSKLRIYSANPEEPGIEDVRIISNNEYEMIVRRDIKGDIFEDEELLQNEQREIFSKELETLLQKINKHFDLHADDTGAVIDISSLSIHIRT
jgi:hypothetical protein